MSPRPGMVELFAIKPLKKLHLLVMSPYQPDKGDNWGIRIARDALDINVQAMFFRQDDVSSLFHIIYEM